MTKIFIDGSAGTTGLDFSEELAKTILLEKEITILVELNSADAAFTAKDKLRLLPALNSPWEQLKKAASIILTACED